MGTAPRSLPPVGKGVGMGSRAPPPPPPPARSAAYGAIVLDTAFKSAPSEETSQDFESSQPPQNFQTFAMNLSSSTSITSRPSLADSSVIVMKSSVSLVYAVKGLTSIPSDGQPHQVPVAKLPFDAKISHVSVPWVEPNVYLRCSIKNTSDYKIFSGPVNILFDDTLVSISSLQVCPIDLGSFQFSYLDQFNQ
jgi:hypothetical protein